MEYTNPQIVSDLRNSCNRKTPDLSVLDWDGKLFYTGTSNLQTVSYIPGQRIQMLTATPVFVSERTDDGIKVKLGDFGIAKFETDVTISKVTKLSDNLADSNASSELCDIRDLLARCYETDDTLRPSSAIIVDELIPHTGDWRELFRSDRTMAINVVNQILRWKIGGTAEGESEWQPTQLVELLRRLLEAGSDAAHPALDRAVDYVNRMLELLEYAFFSGGSQRSASKMSLVLETLSLLRDQGAWGLVHQYDLGSKDYELLQTSPVAQHKTILLKALQARHAPRDTDLADYVIWGLQRKLSYKAVLGLSVKGSFFRNVFNVEESIVQVCLLGVEATQAQAQTGPKGAASDAQALPTEVKTTMDALRQFASDEQLKEKQAHVQKLVSDWYDKRVKLDELQEITAGNAREYQFQQLQRDVLHTQLQLQQQHIGIEAVSKKDMKKDELSQQEIAGVDAANALHEAHGTGTVILRNVETPMVVRLPPAEVTVELQPATPARIWANESAATANATATQS
ncbi:hypothetical protein LTR27_011881 [Elasticomyces elasticus]|nr:hypothetical protein LTR27_011881 [Elasticomyces elasticus]